ncbi:DUF1801 domain-containing protein [Dermatobacter hominis]|uniref:DUF1801 domain-containing protein n=1 Tax=Dermatobacter hominis TaxID=2884263 RepID=UPI001D12DEB2|nr:DUF1801 domain-containing protein [Dermatobacter hominis]UDY37261.1 DUF1801 domain-containing protein [Dermatobacter hominis]
MADASAGSALVDEYLAGVPEPQRSTLAALRTTLRRVLPGAEECIKYGMPAFALDGQGVAGFASAKHHCGYFPFSSTVLTTAGDAVDGYRTSKGGLQFPVDRPLPVGLVRTLVKLRIAELGAVTDGVRREYFADGQLKAEGPMRSGEPHGTWRWYRKDGTVLRTGQFRDGEQVDGRAAARGGADRHRRA